MKNKVLFLPLGGINTASSRLICYENAKYLRQLGWDVQVGKGDLGAFDIVVFQKRFSHRDLGLINQVKGKIVLQISEAYYLKNEGWYSNIVHFMKRAHGIVVGSRPLHEWFSHKHHKKSVIIPTGLDFAALPKGEKKPPLKICWIGNRGNEKYLDQVVGPINTLWRKYNFELRIISGRAPQLGFKKRPNFIPWQLGKAEKQVSECHIGIAPLHCKGYEFAKPPSKPTLYMAQGLATVATETPPYQRLIRDNVSGFLIKNNNQSRWTQVLDILIRDRKRRDAIIANGTKACQRYNAPNIAKQWDAFLKTLV